jgi:hypothetical protein
LDLHESCLVGIRAKKDLPTMCNETEQHILKVWQTIKQKIQKQNKTKTVKRIACKRVFLLFLTLVPRPMQQKYQLRTFQLSFLCLFVQKTKTKRQTHNSNLDICELTMPKPNKAESDILWPKFSRLRKKKKKKKKSFS